MQRKFFFQKNAKKCANFSTFAPKILVMPSNTDEQERIAIIKTHLRTGDRKSAAAGYAYFVKRYSQNIIDFTSRMVQNRADAEDLAQNTFVKAFGAIEKFESRSSFITWISRIAYNESINHLNRNKLHYINIDDTPISETDNLDEQLSTGSEERIRQLESALETLPPDDRLLLHLYYYQDKPIKEIAYIMNSDANTLGVRLHRIRKRLLTTIEQQKKSDILKIFSFLM